MSGTLYLFPTQLGNSPFSRILPDYNIQLINTISYFIVEDIRSARRFLKKCNPNIDIDSLKFYVLNKRTESLDVIKYLEPLKSGYNMGMMSEAGCPGIADPGAEIVSLTQQIGIQVVPLVGPSSILLGLMASGFNGQQFAFNGYLPIEHEAKKKMIKKHENRIYSEDQSQIYIETPYRNNKTLRDFLSICMPDTKLCIAADLTSESEFIQTKKIKAWIKDIPDLNKRPSIFILYR